MTARTGCNLTAIRLPFKLNKLQLLSWFRIERLERRSAATRVYSTSS
jgi:hypothetical protein